MPWIAPGVHALFADPRQEWEYLQKRLAGEIVEALPEIESVIERTLFQREAVKGDLGAFRPGPLSIEPASPRPRK